MRAVVAADPGVPADGVIPLDAPADAAQLAEVELGGGGAADGIEGERYFYAGAGALSENVDDAIVDIAVVKDVGVEVDVVLRVAHGVELGRIETVAVLQRLNAVVEGNARIG